MILREGGQKKPETGNLKAESCRRKLESGRLKVESSVRCSEIIINERGLSQKEQGCVVNGPTIKIFQRRGRCQTVRNFTSRPAKRSAVSQLVNQDALNIMKNEMVEASWPKST